jgi:hypothetical protein
MKKFNEWIALKMTLGVSTMWAFYLFCIYGLVPKIFPHVNQDTILYYSNYIQLIFLPLLAVGNAVMARATEKRDLETHDTVMKSNEAMMEELQLAKEERQELTDLVKYLHEKLENGGK